MATLKDKVIFISGGSRGIGLEIVKRCAQDGAKIVIAAKTAAPHPKLPGTIHTAAEEIESLGGQALPLAVDIRYEDQVEAAMAQAAEHFGGIDILINNASAIFIAGTEDVPMKRYDLMQGVNARGTFLCSQKALPYLRQADNPHVLNLSPPLSMKPKWFKHHTAYTISKYGMSMCMLGMAAEYAHQGIAFNALWPKTAIDTAALRMLEGLVPPERCRKPEIVADAAHLILTRDARDCTGNFFIDEEILRESGISDFTSYAVDPNQEPYPDFFVD